VCAAVAACGRPTSSGSAPSSTRYDDLQSLFAAWRTFQQPPVVDGVPQYTSAAMDKQHRDLATYRARLDAIDPTGWPVNQQVDWYVVRAEMNGMDFDHRVLKPWANNPAYYTTVFLEQSDQPAREGPIAYGSVEVWSYSFPLSAEAASRMDAGIRTIPRLLEQAKQNLSGNGRDLWVFGAKRIKEQSQDLSKLADRVGPTAASNQLKTDIQQAKAATDSFAAWLDDQIKNKNGPSGVGVDNYDWYLKNVQLVPYTWRDEMT